MTFGDSFRPADGWTSTTWALDGTDHPTHAAQASMIRRYIRWRNTNARNRQLTELVKRANVA
jgi:hypothetical protein